MITTTRRIVEALNFKCFYNSKKFRLTEIRKAAGLRDGRVHIIRWNRIIITPIEVLHEAKIEAIYAARIVLKERFAAGDTCRGVGRTIHATYIFRSFIRNENGIIFFGNRESACFIVSATAQRAWNVAIVW